MAENETPLEQFKRATGSTVRALSRREDLTATFAAAGHGLVGTEVRLPMPSRDLPYQEAALVRGQADAIALRQRYHADNAKGVFYPTGEQAQEIFDAVEQARCESLGIKRMSGCAGNLDAAVEEKFKQRGWSRIDSHEQVPLSEALHLLAREVFSDHEAPREATRAVELWRRALAPEVFNDLQELAKLAHDQRAFSQSLKQLLEHLDLEAGDLEQEASDQDQDQIDHDGAEQDAQSQGEAGDDDDGDASMAEAGESTDGVDSESGEESSAEMDGDMMPGAGEDEPGNPGQRPDMDDRRNAQVNTLYKAFTQQFDEEIAAEDLCDADELARLRQMLDQQLLHLQGVISRLANRMQRRLMAKQTRAWEFNLEEGLLDTARLSQVVTTPTHALSFKLERDTDFRDTVVTLLIDNSGSMRGRPISVAAMSADILARTLERCGVKVEILGFTTRMWKGGQSREKWIADGKPALPGRLNDLRHIIYKSADVPLRRARKNLGLMLREGILKENIDGEALLWAHNRLLARAEQRRILMVISDGAPVDDSTLSVNPGNYLEKHLREAIEYIETRSPVELTAIGIGHDVTRYYRRAVTIVDAEQLGGTMMENLADLFDEDSAVRAAQERRKAS
ncbi:cobaltochelatase subunit CobT [Rhodovibrionaceae bacterium A322]